MGDHRKVSANRRKQAKRLAVLAFLGLAVASPGIATASADATEGASSSAKADSGAAPDPGPKADPDPQDPNANADDDGNAEVDDDEDDDADDGDAEDIDETEENDDDNNSDDDDDDDDNEGDDGEGGGDQDLGDDTDRQPAPQPEPISPATALRNHDPEPVGDAVTTWQPTGAVPAALTAEDAGAVAPAPDALMVTMADPEVDEKSPWDFLPQYPDIAGVTKTEVAAVVFIAAAAATVISIPTAPLLTIPLLLVTIAAWTRFEDLGTNHHAPTASVTNKVRLLGVVTGTLIGEDEDGDPVNITLENGPANGNVEIIGSSLLGGFQYVYTANNPFTVGAINDSFTIKVDDYGGWRNHPLGLHSVSMTIDVTEAGIGVNLPPVILPISVGLPDRAGVVRGAIVGADPEGAPLAYQLVNGQQTLVTSKGGIVHLDGEDYVYVPSQTGGGLLGEILDSFDVKVSDPDSATTSVTVVIITRELDFDYTSVLDAETQMVTGDIDAPGNDIALFSYAVGSGPAYGDVTIDPLTGAYTYVAGQTPQNDTFTVIGTDIHGNQLTLTVAVSPFAPNTPPTVFPVGAAIPDLVTGLVTGTVIGTDADGDPLHYSVTGYDGALAAQLANGGMVLVDSDGKWTYIPPVDGGGLLGVVADDFTIYVTDGRGGQASTLIGVITRDLNIGHTANVSGTTVTGGVNIPSALQGLFTYAAGSSPAKGVLTVNPDGTYSYTSTLTGHGTSATDTFTIVGTNADGLQVTLASITVTPELPNTAPSATYVVTSNSSTNLGALSVGSAAGAITVTDADGDTEFTYIVSGSSDLAPLLGTSVKGGVVLVNADGTFNYTSPLGLPHSSAPAGTTDSFTVTVADGFGGTTQLTVTVPINPVNNNPTHVNTTGASGRDLGLRTGGWVTTVADLDLDTVTATASSTTRGSVSISRTAYVFTVTYTSTSSATGLFPPKYPSETFTVTYSDGLGGSVTRSYTF